MWKLNFVGGLALIALSGVLFTIERFTATLQWVSISAPVKMSGSGSYPSEPVMPGFFDNVFVALFLILGSLLFISGLVAGIRRPR